MEVSKMKGRVALEFVGVRPLEDWEGNALPRMWMVIAPPCGGEVPEGARLVWDPGFDLGPLYAWLDNQEAADEPVFGFSIPLLRLVNQFIMYHADNCGCIPDEIIETFEACLQRLKDAQANCQGSKSHGTCTCALGSMMRQ